MGSAKIGDELKREIWRRDEFTCRFCGKTTAWDEVEVVYELPLDCGGKEDPSNLISVCAQCIWEGKTAPVPEEDKKRLLSLYRKLRAYTPRSEGVAFEDDLEEENLVLVKKLEEAGEENQRLRDAAEEKTALAIAYKKKLERAFQDLENYRNRTEREVERKVRETIKSLLLDMIGTLDNLDRAYAECLRSSQGGALSDHLKGLQSIRKDLSIKLENAGLVWFAPLNEPFDPKLHEALGTIKEASLPSDTVFRVETPGYLYQGIVLRPARVYVTKGGEKRRKREDRGEQEKRPEEMEEMEEGDEEEAEADLEEIEEEEKVVPVGPWADGSGPNEAKGSPASKDAA